MTTAAAIITVAGPTTASAASTPSWTVTKVYPAGKALERLSPVSAKDVWAAGETLSGGHSGLLIARWNGGAWQGIAAPAGVSNTDWLQ